MATEWWATLSKEEQEEYLRQHPQSRKRVLYRLTARPVTPPEEELPDEPVLPKKRSMPVRVLRFAAGVQDNRIEHVARLLLEKKLS